jgi:hypothetical protein
MAIPVGAEIRDATGRRGQVVRLHRKDRIRGMTAVRLDGETEWRFVRNVELVYVSRWYRREAVFGGGSNNSS